MDKKKEKVEDMKVNVLEEEKIFVGDDDEEVLNCEGEPCNFVVKEK